MTQSEQEKTQLETKYKAELQALEPMGFKDMMSMHEKAFPFSVILLFFLYPMMKLNGEVFRIESPLRFTILYPVLVNRQMGTFVSVFSKGVTFSTAFNDGTVLSTTNFKTNAIDKPEKQVYRFAPESDISIEDAWAQHQARFQELVNGGTEAATDLSLDKFQSIVQRIQAVAGL